MGSNVLDPIKTANDLFTMCLKHLEHSKGIKNNLYRIFYYDCEPYGKKQHHPLTGQSVDFFPSPSFVTRGQWFSVFNAISINNKYNNCLKQLTINPSLETRGRGESKKTITKQTMSSENYRIGNQNSVYFLTFTITDWVDVFTRYHYRNTIVESLDYCKKNKGLNLYAWCLMTNHMHLICSVDEPFRMSDFIRDFKKFTAKSILKDIETLPESRRDWMLYRFEFAGKFDHRIEKYRFWQDKSHPIELSTNEMINQRINYIHENPVKTGLVTRAEDYLHSSARNYAGLSSVIEIDFI